MTNRKFYYVINWRKGAGFCSELNNILYARYFFKKNKLHFNIISTGWVSAYKNGWNDYFNSLIEEHNSDSIKIKFINHFSSLIYTISYQDGTNRRKHINRVLSNNPIKKILNVSMNLIYGKNCYARGTKAFEEMRNFCFAMRKKDSKLFHDEIHLELLDLWNLNNDVNKEIQKQILEILPSGISFVSIHIRRGDKLIEEDKKYEVSEYIDELARQNIKEKVFFLMSDDYDCYLEMKKALPDYKIITLLSNKQSGYDQIKFKLLPKDKIKHETMKLITEIEIARRSKVFIGTHASNIFRTMEYFGSVKCISISPKGNHL